MSTAAASLRAVLLDVGNTLVYEQQPRQAIYAAAGRARGSCDTRDGSALAGVFTPRSSQRDRDDIADAGAVRMQPVWYRPRP